MDEEKEASSRRIITIFHRFGKRRAKEVKKMAKEQLEEYRENIASLQIKRDEINKKSLIQTKPNKFWTNLRTS